MKVELIREQSLPPVKEVVIRLTPQEAEDFISGLEHLLERCSFRDTLPVTNRVHQTLKDFLR